MWQPTSIQPGLGLPSQRELEQWQAECDRIDEQVAALVRRKRGFEALITAARQLWGDFALPVPAPAMAAADAPPRLRPTVIDPLPPARPPITPDENSTWAAVRAEVMGRLPPRPVPRLRDGGRGDTPASRPRLVERASIVPPKSPLFAPAPPQPQPEAASPPVELLPPAPPAPPEPPSMTEVILAFLDRVSVGAPSAVIIAELRRAPHLVEQVDANKAQVLSLLSRLVDEGQVLKGGGVYYRNRQRPLRAEAAE